MHSGRHFILLGIAALVAVVVAGVVINSNQDNQETAGASLLLPELAAQLDQVTAIHVSKAGSGYSLSRQDNIWRMDSYDGFPADRATIRKIMAGLARMTKLEKKTDNPARHDRLQLQDPAMDSAQSLGLRLEDGNGKTLAAVITGKIIRPAEGSKPARYYARLNGDNQSWIVEAPALPAEEKNWITLDSAKMERSRTRLARISHANGETVSVSRPSKDMSDFTLANIPDGFVAKSEYIANSLGSAMSWPSLERPTRLSGTAEIVATGYFESFDGLILETEALALEDNSNAINLSARVTDAANDKIKAEAKTINALTTGWMFRLPDHKFEDFTRNLAYFIKEESEAAQEGE